MKTKKAKHQRCAAVAICTAVFLAVCLSPLVCAAQDARELIVFAGAGMRAPLDEIGQIFENRSGIRILYDYEGSGSLGNKILAGQRPDVFIPGSEKWAKILVEKGLIQGYSPMAYHTPVVITPAGSAKVRSLADFGNKNVRLVLGDEKAAAIGKPSTAILKAAGFDVSALNIAARGMTVKQLVLWIEGGNADASIVWRADALQSKNTTMIEIPEKLNQISTIPVCLITDQKQESNDFFNYLLGADGKKIFEKHGFKVVQP
jgi:molybdate transport system substrate-binding protein